jgi:hypothetical protein
VRTRATLAILALLLAPALSGAAELPQETCQSWDAYILGVKSRMRERASGKRPFLWIDESPELLQRARAGEVVVGPADGQSPLKISHGLIHHWIGAVFLPNATLSKAMRVLDDYNHYPEIYKPLIAKSKLLARTGANEKVTILMTHKAFSVTAAVRTENDVHIVRVNPNKLYSFSNSIRVQEIADYGEPGEHSLPQDDGPGYVWRSFSVTRLERRDNGVYVEMETIALSRAIPAGLGWLIKSLTERMPREIMSATLEDTRHAVSEEISAQSRRSRKPQSALVNARPPDGTAPSPVSVRQVSSGPACE